MGRPYPSHTRTNVRPYPYYGTACIPITQTTYLRGEGGGIQIPPDKISSGGARVDNDVQSISNGLILGSTVPRVDNDANINQLSTKV